MDNKIIFAGVGLGVLLLLFGSRSGTPRSSDAASVATASLNASAAQAATAPALLDSLTQLQQVQLASSNAHRQSTYDFLTGIDTNNIRRTQDFLAVGAHAMDLSAADKINAREVKARQAIAFKALDTQEDIAREQNKSGIFGDILGFADNLIGQAGGALSKTGGGVGGGSGAGGGNDLITSLIKFSQQFT